MNWIAIRDFLCDFPYNNVGSIGTFILSLSSIYIAVITARMLKKQHELDKEKLNTQQLEHQPLFQFVKNDKSYIISNEGCELSAPITVNLHSMITVRTVKMIDNELHSLIYCHPVEYYKQIKSTGNLKGEVAVASFDSEEYKTFIEKRNKLIAYFQDIRNIPPFTQVLSVDISDVLQINYTDMYNVRRIVHFWNSQKISKERFSQLVTMCRFVPFGLYGVNDIKIEEIIHRTFTTNFELMA